MSSPSPQGNVPAWRTVEQLVATIESALAGRPIRIESPARIRDRVAGSLREVDVAVWFTEGTVHYLTTFECRDHSEPQDVAWVEQASAKRDSVGANKTVLVSTSGFTKPALQKAASLGIEARTLSEVTSAEIDVWCTCKSVTVAQTHWGAARAVLIIRASQTTGQAATLDPAFAAHYKADNVRNPVCYYGPERKPLSIAEIVASIQEQVGPCLGLDAPATEIELGRLFYLTFDPGMAFVPTTEGECEVSGIDLGLITKSEVSLNAIPAAKCHEIRQHNCLITGVIQGRASTSRASLEFDLICDPSTNASRLAIREMHVEPPKLDQGP